MVRKVKSLSILLPVWKETPANVRDSIEAMKGLRYPNKEILFIFEPEERDEAKIVREAGFKVIFTDGEPRLKAHALNMGLAASKGEIIAIYDVDTFPEPDQAMKAIRAIEEGGYDVVSGYPLSSTETLLQRMRTIDLLDWCSSTTIRSLPAPSGYGSYFRREVLEEIGGWDEDTVTEDADLGIKLGLKNYKFGVINSPVYGESSGGFKNILFQRVRWIKGSFQIGRKWKSKTKGMSYRKRIEFYSTYQGLYGSLFMPVQLLVTLYCIYLLVIGVRSFYLWILPLSLLFDYVTTVLITTRRQLVKIDGLSLRDHLFYPIYKWLFYPLAVWMGFIQWKRRPMYWYRTRR